MEHSSKYRIPKISLFSIFRDIYVSRKDFDDCQTNSRTLSIALDQRAEHYFQEYTLAALSRECRNFILRELVNFNLYLKQNSNIRQKYRNSFFDKIHSLHNS